MTKFRIAVVGLGWWGKVMVDRLTKSHHVEITVLVDPFPDTTITNTADTLGINIVENIETAVNEYDIDGVVLCTPNTLHLSQVEYCVSHRKHVYCEKPLSLTRCEAVQMVNVCSQAGVLLGVGHERRFEPAWSQLKAIVENDSLGTIMYAEAHFSHDKLAGLPKDNWRADPAVAPAAGMTGMGVHLTDLMQWLFGPVELVFAGVSHRILDFDTGDVVSASLHHSNGIKSQITAVLKTPHYQRVTVWGDVAWAEVVDSSHPDTPGTSELTISHSNGDVDRFQYEWVDTVSANVENFARAAQGQESYMFTDDEKIGNVSMLEAIKISSNSGLPVNPATLI